MPFLLKCSIFPSTHTEFHPTIYDITPIFVPIIPLANFQFISNKSSVYITSVCSYFLCLYLHKTSGFTKTHVKPDTKQVTAQDLLNTDNMWDFLIPELLRTTDHHHDWTFLLFFCISLFIYYYHNYYLICYILNYYLICYILNTVSSPSLPQTSIFPIPQICDPTIAPQKKAASQEHPPNIIML